MFAALYSTMPGAQLGCSSCSGCVGRASSHRLNRGMHSDCTNASCGCENPYVYAMQQGTPLSVAAIPLEAYPSSPTSTPCIKTA